MSEPARILVVDDEEQIMRVLHPTLEAAGYSVALARTGTEATQALGSHPFDAIILDLGLPDMDGKDVISHIRRKNPVPIIVLSARGSEDEKILALDRGANDYVAKPFAVGELLARIRVALRAQQSPTTTGRVVAEGLEIDFASRRGVLKGAPFRLSSRETELLRVLAAARGAIVGHKDIIAAVCPEKSGVEPQSVRVLVNQVRQKIEANPAEATILMTEPGLGYRLNLNFS
jgi:two-component system KDP operon response regulator KdpE